MSHLYHLYGKSKFYVTKIGEIGSLSYYLPNFAQLLSFVKRSTYSAHTMQIIILLILGLAITIILYCLLDPKIETRCLQSMTVECTGIMI